ncbi:hypothetical protein ACF0H5_024454 [Mactra antiquata]
METVEMLSKTVLVMLLFLVTIDDVTGHGGMLEPPMRSIAWRYGFDTPINYDWMSLYCGGLHEFTRHGGKCGVCGDPYNGPYENARGGVYDTGIIVRHYPANLREIEVKVEITAHHKGYFRFKICANNENEVTQECLDRNPLRIRESDTQGDPYRFYPPREPKLNELHVELPPGMICDRCVLQWTYTAGNNAGTSSTGESCMGCGIQETFVNCADISIGGTVDNIPVSARDTSGPEVVINQLEDVNEIIHTVLPDVRGGVNSQDTPTMNTFPRSRDQSFIEPGTMPTDMNAAADIGIHHVNVPVASLSDLNTQRQPNLNPTFSHQNNARDFIPSSPINTHRSIFPNSQTPGTGFHSPSVINNQLPIGHSIPSHFGHGPNNSPIMPHTGMNNHPLLPPPSQVSTPLLDSVNRFANQLPHSHAHNTGRVPNFGTHSTLLGSIGSVVNRINTANGQNGFSTFSHSAQQRMSSGSPNMLPNQIATHHHGHTGHQNVLSNNHIMPNTHRNFHPSVLAAVQHSRENRLSGRQSQLDRHRLRVATQKAASRVRNNLLPRRILVHSTAVAQHLLRKYPQLKGRVYLSRQALANSTYPQIQHRYARRRVMV